MDTKSQMEFKSFDSIKKVRDIEMSITQKIHGSNAQVFIFENRIPLGQVPKDITAEELVAQFGERQLEVTPYSDETSSVTAVELDLLVGSRTRWITPEDDNFGFARFVYANKAEFIEKLGVGRHFGEWAGPGINSGEGLTQKTFVLFDWWKFPVERPLPPQTVVVPLLYRGAMDAQKIEEVMADLKANGSKLAPGFMRPEGVVVSVAGVRYKKVFEAEETQWKKGDGTKERIEKISNELEVDHLLQPIRLEKLLSRDEKYIVTYPNSLGHIASDYIADLVKEEQIKGTEEEIRAYRKALGSKLYAMIKETMKVQHGL